MLSRSNLFCLPARAPLANRRRRRCARAPRTRCKPTLAEALGAAAPIPAVMVPSSPARRAHLHVCTQSRSATTHHGIEAQHLMGRLRSAAALGGNQPRIASHRQARCALSSNPARRSAAAPGADWSATPSKKMSAVRHAVARRACARCRKPAIPCETQEGASRRSPHAAALPKARQAAQRPF